MNSRKLTVAILLTVVASLWTLSVHASPSVVVVQKVGSLEISNPTRFAYDLYLNHAFLTVSSPGQPVILSSIPTGNLEIEARFRGRQNIPSQRIKTRIRPGILGRVTLGVPRGKLKVTNKHSFPVKVRMNGQVLDVIPPYRSAIFRRIEAGTSRLSLEGPKKNRIHQDVYITPRMMTRWTPRMALSTLQISNPSNKRVRVYIDGRFMGRIRAKQRRTFAGLVPGMHTVVMKLPNGKKKVRSVLTQGETISYLHAPRPSIRKYGHGKTQGKVVVGYL